MIAFNPALLLTALKDVQRCVERETIVQRTLLQYAVEVHFAHLNLAVVVEPQP